jgi:hypothetical protein
LAVAVLAAWLGCTAMSGDAWAQKKGKKNAGVPEAGPEEQGYVKSYFLVVMTAGLGLLVVLRPSRRQEPQQTAYQQPTDIGHGKK